MLYVLTQTPGLSSLGWSPTGFDTTWTTHHQNGDNHIYSSCTLGTYKGRFCIVWADTGKRGYPRCGEEFPRLHGVNSGVCPRFTRITSAHTNVHLIFCMYSQHKLWEIKVNVPFTCTCIIYQHYRPNIRTLYMCNCFDFRVLF